MTALAAVKLSDTANRVLAFLQKLYGQRNGKTSPHFDELADALNLHTAMVQKAMGELSRAGLAWREDQPDKFRYQILGVGSLPFRGKQAGRLDKNPHGAGQLRPCMCCGAQFLSEGKHNRLCQRCRS